MRMVVDQGPIKFSMRKWWEHNMIFEQTDEIMLIAFGDYFSDYSYLALMRLAAHKDDYSGMESEYRFVNRTLQIDNKCHENKIRPYYEKYKDNVHLYLSHITRLQKEIEKDAQILLRWRRSDPDRDA